MSELYSNYPANDCRYLAHHGVKGMKWGVRRERARKARIMRKYGITSKQYESVRDKTRERNRAYYGKNAKEWRKNAQISSLLGSGVASGIGIASLATGGASKSEIGGYAIGSALGTAASYGMTTLLTTPERYERVIEGRDLIDNIIENREFKKLSKK